VPTRLTSLTLHILSFWVDPACSGQLAGLCQSRGPCRSGGCHVSPTMVWVICSPSTTRSATTSSGVTDNQPQYFRPSSAGHGDPCNFSRQVNERVGAYFQSGFFPRHRCPFFITLGCRKASGCCVSRLQPGFDRAPGAALSSFLRPFPLRRES